MVFGLQAWGNEAGKLYVEASVAVKCRVVPKEAHTTQNCPQRLAVVELKKSAAL